MTLQHLSTKKLELPKILASTNQKTDHFGHLWPHPPFLPLQSDHVLLWIWFYRQQQLFAQLVISISIVFSFSKLILISVDKGTATIMWPPVLGQGTRQWPDIFKLVHRPEMLWDVYAPSNSIEEMDIEGIWTCYNVGEAVFDVEGHQTGIKPPLRLLEQWFAARWRTSAKVWI